MKMQLGKIFVRGLAAMSVLFAAASVRAEEWEVAVPAADHSTVAVTNDLVEVGTTNGVYRLTAGTSVRVAYTASNGWSIAANASTNIAELLENVEVFAPTVTANVYAVTFASDIGVAPAAVTYSVESNFPYALPAMAASGWVFNGWTNAMYAVATNELDRLPDPLGDVDLWASWTPMEFALKIPARSGLDYVVSNETDELVATLADGTNGYAVTHGDMVKIYFTVEENWVFAEAFDNPMDLGKITGDTTVDEALLPKVSSMYTLTYKPGDGAGDEVVSNLVYGAEHEVITCPFAKAHYAFAGWTNAEGLVYQPGAKVSNLTDVPGGNVDFTATWEEHEFEIVIPELENMTCRVFTNEVEISPAPYFVVTGETVQVVFEAQGGYLLDAEPAAVKAITNEIAAISGKATFGTSEHPLPLALAKGNVKNPWAVAVGSDQVSAWTNGTANLVIATSRVDIAFGEFVALRDGMGRLPDTFSMILADGSEAPVRLLVEQGKRAFATLADALSAEPSPETLRLYEVDGYWVSYDWGVDGLGEPQPEGEMATDLFYPTIATNLTANAFRRTNFVFGGWFGGDGKTYADGAAGIDFCEPGATLALTAQWMRVIVPVTVTNLEHTTVSVMTNDAPVDLFRTVDGCGIYNVQTNADVTIVYRAVSGWAFAESGTNGTIVLSNVTWSVNDFVPEKALPTVVPIEDVITIRGAPAIITGCKPTADGVLIIPAKIGGKDVTGIADKAFQYATWLRELVIEAGLAEIGNAAFDNCSGLERAVIPASVTKVGMVAFMRCFALKSLEFGGDAPAMQKLDGLGYGVCWGAHEFTVRTASGTEGWSETSLGVLCAGWQRMTDNGDGTYTCTYDSDEVVPRITGLRRLSSNSMLTVSNVKPGLTYTLEKTARLGTTWNFVERKTGGEVDTLEFEIPNAPDKSAFWRVTVSEGLSN